MPHHTVDIFMQSLSVLSFLVESFFRPSHAKSSDTRPTSPESRKVTFLLMRRLLLPLRAARGHVFLCSFLQYFEVLKVGSFDP